MDTSSDLQAGSRLADRYRLDAVIGRGGMATVYRAHDEVLDRPVAVKVLIGTTSSPEALERQSAEARIGARLNHPGLVAVYDVHPDSTPPFLVMELVEGMTLSDAMEHGRIRHEAVAEIGAKLCAALATVHEAGVVHRDMKPSNVLIGDGGGRTVKLTDFGISRLVDAARITQTGELVGTARYLSPEQAGGRHVDTPTDVYAAGLVLLECLTGEPAFPGTQVETLSARLHRDPEVPESLGPGWVQTLQAMTARDPHERPEAGEASQALQALAEGRTPPPIGGTPDPATAALTAPVGAATPDATAAMAEPTTRQPTAAAEADADQTAGTSGGRRGRKRAIWIGVAVAVAVLAIGGVLLALQSGGSDQTDGPADVPTEQQDDGGQPDSGGDQGGDSGGDSGDGGGGDGGGGGGGQEPTEEPTEEPTTEEPTTEEPTEEPTTEEPTEEPTTEPPTTEPTPEPTSQDPSPEPTTEEPPPETPTEQSGTGQQGGAAAPQDLDDESTPPAGYRRATIAGADTRAADSQWSAGTAAGE